MANETLALARPEQTAAPDHYEAFYELLAASERGRAFLAEHARRGRSAETEVLLAALTRIEALVRGGAAQDNAARSELQMLVMVIRSTRPQLEGAPAPERAARLAALVDLLEDRIAALAGPLPHILDAATGEPRPRLAVVPPPEQPELPIRAPAPAVPPSLSVAPAPVAEPERPEPPPAPPGRPPLQTDRPIHDAIAAALDQRAPEPAPQPLVAQETQPVLALETQPSVAVEASQPARPVRNVPPPADPLAALMMLSEDERLALFT